MISVYITCKDNKEAREISRHLLDKRLIACANIFPIESMYWWDGRINDDKETAIIAKTKKVNFDKVKNEITGLHSYDVPCIVSWDIVKGNKEYLDWISKEVR